MTNCFYRLKDHINKHHPKEVLTLDEFLKLRQEVVKDKSTGDGTAEASAAGTEEDDAPPGEDVPPGEEPVAPASTSEETASGDSKTVVNRFFNCTSALHFFRLRIHSS